MEVKHTPGPPAVNSVRVSYTHRMGEQPIELRVDGHVALIRFMRAEKHNAFNRALSGAVTSALDALEQDANVHVIVLTGSGKAFSAGADFSEAVDSADRAGRSDAMAMAVARVARVTKPTLAAINGHAYGGGAALAVTCDIRVASASAAFRFPGAAYGLVVGGAQLPRIVGPAFAKELLFTGRVVSAGEALRMGLVNTVVAEGAAERAGMEMAQMIAANSLEALIATKRTVDRATEVDEAQRLEAQSNDALRHSPEHQQRFRAAAERITR